MDAKLLIVRPEDRPAPLNVVGSQVTVLASERDAPDMQITLQRGTEGSGPPPHSHAWDESFYILSGQVAFTCAGKTTLCTAGTLVHVPGGTVHAFSYGPGGGEMLEVTGRHSQSVRLFTALHHNIPAGEPDVAKIVGILRENGLQVHM